MCRAADRLAGEAGARDVEGIGFGSVWLRRPMDPTALVRTTFEEITHEIEQPVGPHLAAAVAWPGGGVHAGSVRPPCSPGRRR